MADPTRRAILDLLGGGPATTGSLCAEFEMSRFGVAKHIQILTDCGLLIEERRGRERWNHLNVIRFKQATQRWLSPSQDKWSDRLIGFGDYLQESMAVNAKSSSLDLDIRQQIDLPVSRERAFFGLTIEIDRWWGAPFRQAGPGSTITLRPDIGSDMVERSDDGHQVVWARVEEVKPAERLYLCGRFAVVGAVAGRIHFDLAELGPETCRLTLSHQAIGAIPDELVKRFDSGWRDLLDVQFRQHLVP